jgi:hypothetical protein
LGIGAVRIKKAKRLGLERETNLAVAFQVGMVRPEVTDYDH